MAATLDQLMFNFYRARAGVTGQPSPVVVTHTAFTATTTSTTIYTPTGSEQGMIISNVSDTTMWLHLGGGTAAVNASLPLLPNTSLSLDIFANTAIKVVHGGTGSKAGVLTVWTIP